MPTPTTLVWKSVCKDSIFHGSCNHISFLLLSLNTPKRFFFFTTFQCLDISCYIAIIFFTPLSLCQPDKLLARQAIPAILSALLCIPLLSRKINSNWIHGTAQSISVSLVTYRAMFPRLETACLIFSSVLNRPVDVQITFLSIMGFISCLTSSLRAVAAVTPCWKESSFHEHFPMIIQPQNLLP